MIINSPVNNLSFGNVSVNILREYFKKNVDIKYFPISEKVDLSTFDKIDKKFISWLQNNLNYRYKDFSKEKSSLKIWHINGAESKLSDRQYLYTFHELDNLTSIEIEILLSQEKVFVSNNHTKNLFNSFNVNNVVVAPLGFDEDFCNTNKDYGTSDYIHFGLMGKFEKRKHTAKILKLWAEEYGNKHEYRLSCCITNPFMKKEQLSAFINQALGGKRYFNINFIPFLENNTLVNDFMNSIDVDLTGLSGAEGWNLPSFNCTALGKWSIVLNATAHTEWATEDNSILVEPNGLEPAYDNIFFKENLPYNQGNIFTFNDDDVKNAFRMSINKAKSVNENGKKLQEKFTYQNTVEIIENNIE